MSLRLHATTMAVLGIAFLASASQGAEPAAAKSDANWTAPRTADGQPDLSGYWSNATFIPLERPKELGTKEFYTEAEAAAVEQRRVQQEHSQAASDIHYDNVIWQGEKNDKDAVSRRTSIIFDPPDGRIPPLSAEGQARAAKEATIAQRRAAAESAEVRTLAERCITWGADGPPMLGSTYNANVQILQTPGQVVILTEMMHDVRVIPLDGAPHIPAGIHQLGGDSRGHWEGDTLVVDSTNFNDETNFRGPPATARQDIFSSPRLHVVERFTRISNDTIIYRFTVDDPGSWTKPWSGELLMSKTKGPIFEYACHEGNYGLVDILEAARLAEKSKASR
ncbi:MAG TPA: hypothetical protein VMB25_06865 [Bryobacteraceae bacterium]|nr:hypothetical protein [Bryobacteraceae bacterium]